MTTTREEIFIKQPNSLRDFCVDSVSHLLLSLNNCKLDAKFPWMNKECNPFIAIPSQLTEEIVERFRELLSSEMRTLDYGYTREIIRKQRPFPKELYVKKELFKILYCKSVKNVDLRWLCIQAKDVPEVLHTFDPFRSEITHFAIISGNFASFKFCDDYTYTLYARSNGLRFSRDTIKYLKRRLPSMLSLTHLMLNCIANDELLERVGASCPNLVVLEIDSFNITSKGLRSLCLGKQNARRCQKLEEVRINYDYQWQLEDGIKILLKCLPRLRSMGIGGEIALLFALKNLFKESPDFTCRLAKYSYWGNNAHEVCSPSFIVKTCPFLVQLELSGPSSSHLSDFGVLKNLRKLSLANCLRTPSDVIIPFLKSVGESLTYLSISNVPGIDFKAIDKCCPHLKSLHCQEPLSGAAVGSPVFEKLEVLSISGTQALPRAEGNYVADRCFTDLCVELTSRCRNLVTLYIFNCNDFEKSHLKTILSRNPLERLKHIDIRTNILLIAGTIPNGSFLQERLESAATE